jgi:hypothetical protein
MMRRNNLLIGAACLAAAAFPAYFAYQVVEWPGVGILGLVIACLAARVELESEGPVGHPRATGIYAASLQGRDSMSRSERAERRAESAVMVRGARIAMVTGALLIVLGGTGFFLS